MKNGWISLQKEKIIQEESRSEQNEILKRTPNYKSKDQISTIKVIQWTGKVLDFYNDYTIMILMLYTNQIMEKGSIC